MRRESPAEKVSIAVVSSRCGAVCRGRPRAAVENSRTKLSSGFSRCQWLKWQGGGAGELRYAFGWPTKKQYNPSKKQRRTGVWTFKLYLVQVRHEVLVERADQHVQGPLTLLGKRWRLQCGFLSIDYCGRWGGKEKLAQQTTQMMQIYYSRPWVFPLSYIWLIKSPWIRGDQ